MILIFLFVVPVLVNLLALKIEILHISTEKTLENDVYSNESFTWKRGGWWKI